jgi:hypothetical protein
MSRGLPHNKLQVHYRVLQQGETETVMSDCRWLC